ncbi:MAG: site-specific integrase [Caulobacteraceae bacterium]
MEVVRVRTEENHIRYYLADDDGLPVEPVLRFLKLKDNTRYARNTLRMYCQHLKQYFTYLGERKKEFADVTIDDLAGFIAWLQNPYIHRKVVPLLHKPARKPQTVSNTVDTEVCKEMNNRARYDKTSKTTRLTKEVKPHDYCRSK